MENYVGYVRLPYGYLVGERMEFNHGVAWSVLPSSAVGFYEERVQPDPLSVVIGRPVLRTDSAR